jgi:signal transduction histidine kinase
VIVRYDKQLRKLDAIRQRAEKAESELARAREEATAFRGALESTMHEVRRLTSSLSGYANTLHQSDVPQQFRENVATVLHTSGMITARLAYTDIQLNPGAISGEVWMDAGLYKKFEKARYVLAQKAKQHRIDILFHGESRSTFRAITVFELIPFLLLDNAVKYSPRDAHVEVFFSETKEVMKAEVVSFGPPLEREEASHLFEAKFRGRLARDRYSGDGLGLYVTRQIASFHDLMTLHAVSDSAVSCDVSGARFNQFRVTLTVGLLGKR